MTLATGQAMTHQMPPLVRVGEDASALDGTLKILPLIASLLPLSASAEGFVEAVDVEQLTGLENTYLAWAPDGTKIVFESTRDGPDNDIFIMDVDGTRVAT